MITQIGIIAGEIWHLLEKEQKVNVSSMLKKLEKPRDTILMSIGWLAREGHIVLEGDSSDYEVSLRKMEKTK